MHTDLTNPQALYSLFLFCLSGSLKETIRLVHKAITFVARHPHTF